MARSTDLDGFEEDDIVCSLWSFDWRQHTSNAIAPPTINSDSCPVDSTLSQCNAQIFKNRRRVFLCREKVASGGISGVEDGSSHMEWEGFRL